MLIENTRVSISKMMRRKRETEKAVDAHREDYFQSDSQKRDMIYKTFVHSFGFILSLSPIH